MTTNPHRPPHSTQPGGPADNVLARMQIAWPPRTALVAGAVVGTALAASLAFLSQLGQTGRIEFELTVSHHMAVDAAAAVLAALTLTGWRTFLAFYGAWAGAYAVVLPALLSALVAEMGAGHAVVALLVLVQVAALWSIVGFLLLAGKTWLLGWVERRLTRPHGA